MPLVVMEENVEHDKHGGEKSNKCSQCDFASSHADSLKTHMKTHSRKKKQINVTSVLIHLLMQAI